MANRILHTARAANHGLVLLSGFITVSGNGGRDMSATAELVGVTLTRPGAGGTYDLTLTDKYSEILYAHLSMESAGGGSNEYKAITSSHEPTKVRFLMTEGGRYKLLSASLAGYATGSMTALTVTYVHVGRVPVAAVLQSVGIVHNADVATNVTNFATYHVKALNGAGAATTTYGRMSTSSISFTTNVVRALGLGVTTITANAQIVVQRLIGGTGVATPPGRVTVAYNDVQTRTFVSGKIHYLALVRNSTVK